MQLHISEVVFSNPLAWAWGKFIFDCSRGKAGVGSCSLFWEASGCTEEVEDLGDTSHNQSCREGVALYEKDSRNIINLSSSSFTAVFLMEYAIIL